MADWRAIGGVATQSIGYEINESSSSVEFFKVWKKQSR